MGMNWLELSQSSVTPNTIIEASFKFLIYGRSYGKHKEHQVINHSFQAASRSSGTACMIALNTLKESSQFLLNNSCIFGIKFIKVATVKASTTLETLFVQKTSIFNESGVHTWEIEDVFALKSPCYSPEFEVGGYTWYIKMYTSHDGNHLSISLLMKRPNHLPKDSANLVEFTLSIKDQESGKHQKLTGRCQFSDNAPGWGWKKLISLQDFKDASKGYLIKGKCCIEAEVALVGSSKTVVSYYCY